MNFCDQGIIITKNIFKENSSIVTLFTKNHGLYSGVVRQYSKKNGDVVIASNLVDFFWSARLHEHLGQAKCELIKSYSNFIMQDKMKLYAFNSIVSIIKKAFCEREPHNKFFPKFLYYLELQKNRKNFSFVDYIQLEFDVLAETGYQIILDKCVVTNSTKNLIYVSPKSGRAVCAEIGKDYANKLLILPQFLLNGSLPTIQEKRQALKITSYFLSRYILQNALLMEREIFIEKLLCL